MPKHKRRYIASPKEGWEPHSWYLIEASLNMGNPIHRALFYTGFLDKDGQPENYSGYHSINAAFDDERVTFDDILYLRVVRRLTFESDESYNSDPIMPEEALPPIPIEESLKMAALMLRKNDNSSKRSASNILKNIIKRLDTPHPEVIHMEEHAAMRFLSANNIKYRTVSRDGNSAVVTCDYKPDRANLHIVNGYITKVTWG